MVNHQGTIVEANVGISVLYHEQIGPFDWKVKQGKNGKLWEANLGDTMVRTVDRKIVEVESRDSSGLDGYALFASSWYVTSGSHFVSLSGLMKVNRYLHIRWLQKGDPDVMHQADFFKTGVIMRTVQEVYAAG